MIWHLFEEIQCKPVPVSRPSPPKNPKSKSKSKQKISHLHIIPRIIPNSLIQLLSPLIQRRNLRCAFRDREHQNPSPILEGDIGCVFNGGVDLLCGFAPAEIVGSAEEDYPVVGEVFG